MTLSEYLQRVVFNHKRSFTLEQFREFMFAESKPFPEMIELVRDLKEKLGLKIFVVSNEGRELNAHRIQSFGLDQFVDTFVSSSYVGMRKPDLRIFKLALDLAQVQPEEVLYLENTPLFVELAQGLGVQSLLHKDFASTQRHLKRMGLIDKEVKVRKGVLHGTEKFTRA